MTHYPEERWRSDWLELQLNPQDFERLSGQAVTMHAVLSLTVYRNISQVKIRASAGWTRVPGFGSMLLRPDPQSSWLWWRKPLLQWPERFLCTVQRPDSTIYRAGECCGPNDSEMFHFSPVVFFAAPFEPPFGSTNVPLPTDAEGDCVVESPAAVILRDLRIPNIRLADWLSQD